jgi:hypothetical protein
MAEVGSYSIRLGVWNLTDRPRIVWVEPWARDYTLLPKEKLEIVAHSETEPPRFNVLEHEYSTGVYLEGGTSDYDVFQDGNRIECGHQRQAALNAGLKLLSMIYEWLLPPGT